MRAMFFGCIDMAGHYLYETKKYDGQPIHQLVRYPGNNPWGMEVDQGLCPGFIDPRTKKIDSYRSKQTEGIAKLHRKDGWTAIAWWDRCGDTRPGSNSVFMAEGEHDFASMLTLFKQKFPVIAATREQKFKIVEAEDEKITGVVAK